MQPLRHFRYRLSRDMRLQVEAQLQVQRLYPPRMVMIPLGNAPEMAVQFDADGLPVRAPDKAKLN